MITEDANMVQRIDDQSDVYFSVFVVMCGKLIVIIMNFPQIQYILLFKTSCTYLQYASLKLENNCTKLHFSSQKCTLNGMIDCC